MSRAVRITLVAGLAAVLALVVALLLFDAPLEYGLDCNRFRGTCTFTQRLMVRSRVGQARIDSLERAEVRAAKSRRRRPRHLVWVISRDGDRFVAEYRSRPEADAAAQRINVFLRDPSDGRLVLTRSVRTTFWIAWALIPVVAALLVAVAAALFGKKEEGEKGAGTPQGRPRQPKAG